MYKMLQKLDPDKSLGPDYIHPRVLRELADIAARLLSIMFEKPWRSQKTGRSLISTPSTRRAKRRIQKISGSSVLTFRPWESHRTNPPGAITIQMKHMTGKSHNRLAKGKLYVTNLMAFNDRVICSADVVDIFNLHFAKALNMVSHSFLLEKQMCYSLDESVRLLGNWLAGHTQSGGK